jgi:hypothetical protein
MCFSIIHQVDQFALLTVYRKAAYPSTDTLRIENLNSIYALAETVIEGILLPFPRDAGLDQQQIALTLQTQDIFKADPI